MKESITIEFKDKADKEYILNRINKLTTASDRIDKIPIDGSLRDKIEDLTFPTIEGVLDNYKDRYAVDEPEMDTLSYALKSIISMYIKISNTDMSDNRVIIKDNTMDNYRDTANHSAEGVMLSVQASEWSIRDVKLNLDIFMEDMIKRIARDMNKLEKIGVVNYDIKQLEVECRMKPEIARKARFSLFKTIEVTEADFDIRYRCIL